MGLILALVLMGSVSPPARAQTAQVQIIHNAPDPAVATVDLYLEDSDGIVTTLDDVDFRTATAFRSVPADTYDIVVAEATSAGIADQVLYTEGGVTLSDGSSSIIVAVGVLDPSRFEANPTGRSTAFELQVNGGALTTSSDGFVKARVAAGAPDAPSADIAVPGGTLVGSIPYGDNTGGYISLLPDEYRVTVTRAGDASEVFATFGVDLRGRADTPVYLLASGFLTPDNEPAGAPGYRFIAVDTDGTVRELQPVADLQVIHNAAGVGEVDIYVDDGANPPEKLDNFPFRGAVNIFAPAERAATISINAASSTGIADQPLASTNVNLDANTFNQAIALGRDAADLSVLVQVDRPRMANNLSNTDIRFVHGTPDAPTVDILTRGALLVDGLAYKGVSPTSGAVSLPVDGDGSYLLRVGPDDNTAFLASAELQLRERNGGEATTILASGFLRPASGQPGFALFAVESDIGGTNAAGNGVRLPSAPQTLLINEFFAAPGAGDDANNDGAAGNDDEFVEVVNVTDGDINASGTVIEDEDGNTYTMPTGTVIPARQSAVVFRGGTPTGIPNIVDAGAPGLDNSGGTLRLKAFGGTVLDEVMYGDGGRTPAAAGESTTRAPDYFGPMALSGTDLGQAPPYTPGRTNDDGAVLPVELTGFRGQARGAAVVLQWTTLSEQGNTGFEVQRRVAGAFRTVAFAEGQGTTAERTDYRVRLAALPAGTHTVRLRQVDADGTATLSESLDVTVGLGARYVWTKMGPNPVAETAYSSLQVREGQRVVVQVYDVLGRRVQTLHDGPMREGQRYPLRLDGRRLPSGTYFLRAVGETFRATQRMSVVH